MSRLSAENRSFLLRTSIAGLLNGALADALTDRADGHVRLGELARGGALLAPVDRRGDWYRYHALFRELLQAELRSESPDLIPSLHRRAASWFADHGDEARGLVHAVEAEAWDLAARLAGERWVDLLIRGEVGALDPLIERLPVEWAEQDPELALAVARALLDRGDHVEAEEMLVNAETAAERVPPELHERFVVSVAALRMHLARLRGDLGGAVEMGRALMREGHLDTSSVDAGLRALALVHLGIAEVWAGDAEEAEHHLGRARGAAAETGRDWLVLMAVAHLALLGATTADYARSARLAGDAIALAEHHRLGPDLARRRRLPRARERAVPVGPQRRGRTDARACPVGLSETQERPLRACLALLRATGLDRRGELESPVAVLGSGVEELGGWPLMPSIRNQFAVREAVLRAALGEPEQAARLVGGAGGEPASLAAAVVLGQLRLADGDAEAARELVGAWSCELEQKRTPASVQG